MQNLLRRLGHRANEASPGPAFLAFDLPRPAGVPVEAGTLDLSGVDQYLIGRAIRERGVAGYEPEVLALLCALVEAGQTDRSALPVRFLDIGANIGFFSLVLTALFGGRMHATAFEPMPSLAEFVRTTARRNRLDVDVREIALSDHGGRSKFYVSSQSDTSNSLNASFRPHKDVIDVEITTLDALYPDGLPGACVMKVDTESTEPDVLEGGRGFIGRHRPAIVCEVLAGRTEDRLATLVDEFGYLPIHVTDSPDWSGAGAIKGDASYRHRDWLFVPAPVPDRVCARFSAWFEAIAGA
jgi:FkbM family methyltransferase